MMTDEQQQTRQITSLQDFAGDNDLIAEILTLDGVPYEIPIRKLPLDAWIAAGRDVQDPKPPEMGWKPDGSVILNYNDPAYLEAKEEAENERLYHRILACLRIEIPGKSKAAQVKALRETLRADVTQMLGSFILQLHNSWRRTVKSRAESFHGLRSGDDAGDSENREPGMEPTE